MKVLHVATYDSPDGAFGGPLTVAKSQARALAELGHEVTLFTAAPVARETMDSDSGFRIRRFPAQWLSRRLGFAALHSGALRRALRRELAEFDVAHVHIARDLVTLPAVHILRGAAVPYVLQPHGMIDDSSKVLAVPVDGLLTRPALRGARSVLALTAQEESDLREVGATGRVVRIANGVQLLSELPPYSGRPRVVLFLARLHARKRPVAFVELAAILAARFPDLEFRIAGPDEGEANAIQQAIIGHQLERRVEVIGAVAPGAVANVMQNAAVYVLPAVDEVFPMTLLEAFQAGTPAVVTDSLGIASLCREYRAAMVENPSPADLADAVADILTHPERATTLRTGARRMLESELDIRVVATRLTDEYRRAMA